MHARHPRWSHRFSREIPQSSKPVVDGSAVRRGLSRLARRGLLGLMFLQLLLAGTVQAHPFGSRFLAHLVVLKVEPQRIQLDYMIEVPTTIIMREFYQALKGRDPSREEDNQFVQAKLAEFQAGLPLTIDGKPVQWRNVTDPKARNGVGNMNFFTYHLNLEATWQPALGQDITIGVQNKNYSDFDPVTGQGTSFDPRENRGMQEGGSYFSDQLWASDVVKVSAANVWALQSQGGAVDAAGSWFVNPALRQVNLTVQVSAATGGPAVALNPKETAAIPQTAEAVAAGERADGGSNTPQMDGMPLLNYLKRKDLDTSLWLIALVMSLFFGAGHALSPGHGKTLVAAYLIGSRGTLKHALWLGLSVTVAHTSSVILLGLVTLFASRYVLPETLVPYLGIFSGLGIVGIGGFLLVDRWKHRAKSLTERVVLPAESSGGAGVEVNAGSATGAEEASTEATAGNAAAATAGAAAPHFHSQWSVGEEHSHSPLEVVPQEISLKQLVRLGFAGGLVPCPTATVVLMTAIALNRIVFGLALVIAFSAGLAAVLVLIGVAMVLAGERLKRFSGSGPLLRYLPVVSAVLVTLLGGLVTFSAVQELRGGTQSFEQRSGMGRGQ